MNPSRWAARGARLWAAGGTLAGRMVRFGGRILSRIVLGAADPGGEGPLDSRLLPRLGHLSRREERLAFRLGRLSQALGRRGFPLEARHLARNAFDHWCLARRARRRIRLRGPAALGEPPLEQAPLSGPPGRGQSFRRDAFDVGSPPPVRRLHEEDTAMSAQVESMMYHGARPWHGVGVALDRPATSAEAIRAASLDWRVCLFQASALDTPIPGAFGVVRMDRHEPIAVVGERYVPVQNLQAFEFFDQLVGGGDAVYETAGSLDVGRRIWLLARLPGDVWVTKEDPVGKFLLLTNSHDGRSPLRALLTPIRVVCENTLRAALADGSGVSIRHTGDILEKAREAQRLLGISSVYYSAFQYQSQALARHELSGESLEGYFAAVLPDPEEADPARARRTRESFRRLFESGKGNALPTVRGTLWAALNAVCEFIDHERPTRGAGDLGREFARFRSSQFGSGAALRARAWKAAILLLRTGSTDSLG